ncbi:MAG: rhodanese-like domain-containing protein [Actinobacteria bacterium]|uniref:Unannotated protein n=1 Tax=freshwater metagenome TaxID=449393 RepID=A0A6J5Z607_9ZZZZ|nr:rhodanese-like domain-containing protein [Actinomycetota bacterium]
MRKKLLALITISLLALTGCSSSGGYHTESAADFAITLEDASVAILDVRTADEYASGRIPHAINIDVEASDFDTKIAKLDKSKTYAVYCHSGRRSAIAAGKLVSAGFLSIHNLDGGITSWVNSGGEVELP